MQKLLLLQVWLKFALIEANLSQLQFERNFSHLTDSVNEIVKQTFVSYSNTVNIIEYKNTTNSHQVGAFKDELMKKLFIKPEVLVRQESSSKMSKNSRKRCSLIVIESLNDFQKVHLKMTPSGFKYSGLYLIVSLNGTFSGIENF